MYFHPIVKLSRFFPEKDVWQWSPSPFTKDFIPRFSHESSTSNQEEKLVSTENVTTCCLPFTGFSLLLNLHLGFSNLTTMSYHIGIKIQKNAIAKKKKNLTIAFFFHLLKFVSRKIDTSRAKPQYYYTFENIFAVVRT